MYRVFASAVAIGVAVWGCGGGDDDTTAPVVDAASIDGAVGAIDAPVAAPDAPTMTPDAAGGVDAAGGADAAGVDATAIIDAASIDATAIVDAASIDATAIIDAASIDASPPPDARPPADAATFGCPDTICQAAENCSTCPADCGECDFSIDGGVAECPHDECTVGAAMAESCSECAAAVCLFDSFCCTTTWDSICVGEVETECGKDCS